MTATAHAGVVRRAAGCALVAWIGIAADAASALTQIDFTSDPGDYLGQGLTFSLTPTDGTITGGMGPSGLGVAFNAPPPAVSPKTSWNFLFAARAGDTLGPGGYFSAWQVPFQSPTRPGLNIFGDGRSCNVVTGKFTIYELSLDGTGNVVAFAADVEHYCGYGPPALHVRIRINSAVPLVMRMPQAFAGYQKFVYERALVLLNGSESWEPNGKIVAFHWTQQSGPLAVLEGPDYASTQFRAPDVAAGGADLLFRLDVTDDSGNHAPSDVAVHVYDRRDRRMLLTWRSPFGDWIGGGNDLLATHEDGLFAFTGFAANTGAEVDFDGAAWNTWNLDFMAGAGMLVPATYLGAQRYPFQPPGVPGLSISGSGRGCNTLTGQFTVMEADFALQRFGVRFEQSCEGIMPPLKGTLLFDAVAPGDPVARVSAPASAPARQSFTLDGSASSSTGSTLVSYRWRQLSGTPAGPVGMNWSLPVLHPSIACKGKQRFELEVADQDGVVDYAVADVDIVAPPPAIAAAKMGLFRKAQAAFLLDSDFDHVPDVGALFGAPTDKPAVGDLDGDGVSDLVVYRNGLWYVDDTRDGNADAVLGFGGAPNDVPLLADMDCNGRANLVIYRDGVWYVDWDGHHIGIVSAVYGFGGVHGDVPLLGDLDGDGKLDLVIYRNGVWYADFDRDGTADAMYGFGGVPGDIPLLFDFDGDGRDDLVIFRNGVWFVSTNRDGNANVIFGYGAPGDVPLAGRWK